MSRFERQMKRRAERSLPKERRVVLHRPPGRDQFGSMEPGRSPARGDRGAWAREWERASRSGRKTHPVVRLTEHGIDYGTEPRPGDEIGYCMDPYRTDDCLQAAIATATQVAVEQVPDLELDRRLDSGGDPEEVSRTSWERIDRWASERGLALMFWERVPVPRRRWIGVVISPNTGATVIRRGRVSRDYDEPAFNDHCLVMEHERLVFDPSCSVRTPPGMQVMGYRPDMIDYGISFDKEED